MTTMKNKESISQTMAMKRNSMCWLMSLLFLTTKKIPRKPVVAKNYIIICSSDERLHAFT